MLRVVRPWLPCKRLSRISIRPVCVSNSCWFTTLAIESSCDDTSVAILERVTPREPTSNSRNGAYICFHEKITANSKAYDGIHPIIALESHQVNLARLVDRALQYLPRSDEQINGLKLNQQENIGDNVRHSGDGYASEVRIPDLVSVTRGPGMRSNLSVGLDFAKGLGVAWQRPLVGVHHMQAHALTPRLVCALHEKRRDVTPSFPFLSLLVSGGHTLLLHSSSLVSHTTLATTTDIAIGDALDKIARVVLHQTVITRSTSTMFGPLLERFAFPNGSADYDGYETPNTRAQELTRRVTEWGWGFQPPLAVTQSGTRNKSMEYSFSGLCSAAERFVERGGSGERRQHNISEDERRDLAREAMRVAFEHLATRVVLGLNNMKEIDQDMAEKITTLVISGGVAANGFLKKVLRSYLDARGYGRVDLVFPPVELCTDNAAMVAWAGMEMFEAGYETDLGCRPLRKWSMDPHAEDGGILGVGGWRERRQESRVG